MRVILRDQSHLSDSIRAGTNIGLFHASIPGFHRSRAMIRCSSAVVTQEEGDAMMQTAFGPHYQRLAALKRRYDPENLFRLNQNIKPE